MIELNEEQQQGLIAGIEEGLNRIGLQLTTREQLILDVAVKTTLKSLPKIVVAQND
ncbi:hypothetical protein [Sutcliffiella horikoshii]|uniref:hypothetical protein n=1 Tax=Sutcliffiella horikoshii TaxID=79883 RepID=UPI0016535CCD|nr:hypothetical protein [Sutcliffiella horikoshii]